MVNFLSHRLTFDSDWKIVTAAIWQRYPNPFARHVLTVDTLERRVDPFDGTLSTTRVVCKTGKMPAWLTKWAAMLMSKYNGISSSNMAEAVVVEDSVVNPGASVMHITSTNLNHTRLLRVQENLYVYRGEKTILDMHSSVTCQLKYLPKWLARRVETHGQSKIQEHWNKTKAALHWIIERQIKDRQK